MSSCSDIVNCHYLKPCLHVRLLYLYLYPHIIQKWKHILSTFFHQSLIGALSLPTNAIFSQFHQLHCLASMVRGKIIKS